MKHPVWITETDALFFHRELITAFGGEPGVRDPKLLQSALARPQNHRAYIEEATLPELAAVYAHGLAKNHPFVDGNKRIAFAVARIFLGLNGIVIKSHGGTDPQGFATAVELGYSMVRNRLLERINSDLSVYHQSHDPAPAGEVAEAGAA